MGKRRRDIPASEADSELVERTQGAVTVLRIDLLHAASAYGAVAAVIARNKQQMRAWVSWLEWVVPLEQRLVAMAKEFDTERYPASDEEDEGELGALLAAVRDVDALDIDPHIDLTSGMASEWVEVLEQLAESARAIEELGGEPINEIPSRQFPIGVSLLGATEDSLILLTGEDEVARVYAASSEEMHRRVLAARAEGVWSRLDPGDYKSGSKPPKDHRGRRDRTLAAVEIRDLLGNTWSETAQFYGRLEPDGRELNQQECVAARERLQAGAVSLRARKPTEKRSTVSTRKVAGT